MPRGGGQAPWAQGHGRPPLPWPPDGAEDLPSLAVSRLLGARGAVWSFLFPARERELNERCRCDCKKDDAARHTVFWLHRRSIGLGGRVPVTQLQEHSSQGAGLGAPPHAERVSRDRSDRDMFSGESEEMNCCARCQALIFAKSILKTLLSLLNVLE